VTYLLVFVVVLGVNLLPAFGPPTAAVLVLFLLESDLRPVPLIAAGATAAALGRLALAHGTRLLRHRFSADRKASLDALAEALEARRHASIIGLGLFALSPLPSAQLFEAAGLSGIRLPSLVLAFFAGRVVSYSLYVSGASAVKETSFGDLVRDSMTSPVGIALQVLLLGAVVAIGRVDWRKHLKRRRRASG
jgi:uncharacterized membrane protein YdjX (TVP38/TMEM64 family)